MEEVVHDDMLFNMLKECRTVPIFMDHFFGFLKRRTDFYVVSEDANSPIGLPPGLAESLVRQTYMKYANNSDDEKSTKKENIPTKCRTSENKSSDFKADPAKCYNGASFESYSWSQTYNEVDLFLKIPKGTTGKDLMINTSFSAILIKSKNGTVFLQGDLCQSCKLDPIWSIDGLELQVHFEKSKEIWWDCFLKSEPRLDITKIECTKPLEDLPEDAQAKIQELQWNQEQKRLGLPTSGEINNLNVLKKAWNAEGSPFSGPFDPSIVSFSEQFT